MTATELDRSLADAVADFYADPLGFVLFAYPWGEKGPLENEEGPDENQREFLSSLGKEVRKRKFDGATPVMPIQMCEASGHGTGKSAMGAWITDWILSTRPDSLGTVTAGTAKQLETRTWAAIQPWSELCITAHWFDIRAKGIFSKVQPKTWNVTPQTCKPENAQSFAGQHAKRSTSWYLFDEASAVPDTVWGVALGGLTDGEPMFFAWGQPERNTGQFYEITSGRERDRWNHRRVDSRSSRFTNKSSLRSGSAITARTRTGAGCASSACRRKPRSCNSSIGRGSKQRRNGRESRSMTIRSLLASTFRAEAPRGTSSVSGAALTRAA